MSNEFDFVIVEGGSAGTALAARLSEGANATVALVEAGGRPPEHEEMPVPRRKMLGGSLGRKCLSITDVVIIDGEETRVAKQMCRGADQSQYAIMV